MVARLGTQVALVELLDRLAPLEEPEAGAAIAEVFADEAISVHTGAQLTRVTPDPDGREVVATVRPRNGRTQQLHAQRLLVATGRRPVTDGLNLEAVGVKVGDRGQLVDVLPAAEYANEHLPAAVYIPLKQLDATSAARLDRDRPVVVYCHDSL